MSENSVSVTSVKTALITGAAGALGSALARQFASQGFAVAIADRDEAGGRKVAEELSHVGGGSQFTQLDVTSRVDWERTLAQLQQHWDRLDVLVNCAGTLAVGDFGTVAAEDYCRIINVNLMGTIHGCHVFCPWLKASPGTTHIVNVASCAAFLTLPFSAEYNSSKAGVLALSETLAAELAPYSVQVTTACPAFFRSKLLTELEIRDPLLDKLIGKLTARSRISPESVAQQVWDAMQRRRPYVVTPLMTRLFWWQKRLLPGWATRGLSRRAWELRDRMKNRA